MTDFLMLAFVFLVAGVISVPIATRLGLGSVLGYLIAGILISPVLALLHVDVIAIQHFAEFGVVMMLFLVGLELEPKLLWAMRHRLLGLGGGQVTLTALSVMGVAMLFGVTWSVALAVGLVLALSSTAIVLQTLNEKGLMKSDGGQSSFSVLLTQDIAVIPMLAFIPLLALSGMAEVGADMVNHAEPTPVEMVVDDPAAENDHDSGLSLVEGLGPWSTAMVTIGAVAFVVLCGSFLTSPIFRFIAGANLRELFTATALMMVIGIALLMSLVGLSPALGTFLAGVVLANSEYRHELESDIDPFKGLLLGLFFMTVGAGVDFALLSENLLLIVGLTLLLIAVKTAVLLLLSVVFKINGADRWLFALGLAQAGEFGFVLLSFTVASNVIPAAIADQLLLVVALSMLLTPLLFILYDRVIVPRFAVSDSRDTDTIDEARNIIVAGHGRMGVVISRMLTGAGLSATVIDYSSKQIDMLSQFGFKAYYGDATRPDLLHAAGIDGAKVFIVAIDNKDQATELVRYITHTHPHVHVVARAIDRNHVYDLWHAGCRDVVRETFDSATRMGRSVYEALGIPREKSDRMVQAFRDTDGKSVRDMAEHYDPDVPTTDNAAYMTRVREMIKVWEGELVEENKRILAEPDQDLGSKVADA